MAGHRYRPPSNPPEPGARLPALAPAGRELLEVLWSVGRPLTTRQLLDGIARCFPHRAGRKIQTVSTLVAELMAQKWVVGEKGGGTRWVYRPAVSRGEGLSEIARWVVEEFVRERSGSCRWPLLRRESTHGVVRVQESLALRPSPASDF